MKNTVLELENPLDEIADETFQKERPAKLKIAAETTQPTTERERWGGGGTEVQ